jgi:hypothetical protein
MCGKGGSPPVPGSTSTAFQSATAANPNVAPMYQSFLANANNLSQTPFNPAMMGSVAPMNTGQIAAGSQLAGLGMDLGNFDPNAVTSMESPFTSDVVNATQNWFNNQNAIQGTDLMSQAIRSGNAFGGDRAGVAEAQLAGQQQLAQAPVIAGLRQAGYTQALNEYNQLKQYGLAGAQAALGWGTAVQQQAQREADVAQQNAMMSSAYPFQLANWYGSTLGGIGPLQGTFAQGYTTPPNPNLINQGIGIASSLAGIGTSLFGGKYGGPVGRRYGGGVVPLRVGGIAMPRYRRGGLMAPYPRRFQVGGLTGFDPSGFSDPGGNLDPARSNAPPNAGALIQHMMDQQQRQKQGTTQDDSLAGIVKNAASLATKAAPLFALLRYGGPVPRFQEGGNADEDDNDTGQDVSGRQYAALTPTAATDADTGKGGALALPQVDTMPLPPPRPPQAGLGADRVPRMGTPEAMRETPTPEQARVYGEGAEGGEDYRVPGEERAPAGARPTSGAGVPGGGGRGVYAGTETIPGLGPQPRTFSQRLATNPLLAMGAAMLSSRSPYFGVGLGAGLQAMQSAAAARGKEEMFDQHPQLIDDGQTLSYRVGDKIIKTTMPSPKARAGSQAAQLRADSLINQYTKENIAALQNDREWANSSDTEILQEARVLAREQWNKEHPQSPVPVPERAARSTPPAATAEGTPGPAGPPGAAPPMTVTSQKPPTPPTPPSSAPTPPAVAGAPRTSTEMVDSLLTDEEKARGDRLLSHDEAFKTPNTINPRTLAHMNTTPEDFDFMAQQVAYGAPMHQFVRGAGKNATEAASALRARAVQFLRDQGWTPQQANGIMQQYAGRTAGARVLAQQEARLTNAIQEVRATAPRVLEISDRIKRTQYPMINDLILAAQKHTGGEEVVRLGAAAETLINDYAATLGRGNGTMTDEARRRANELLERGYSHGQMGAVVDQMLIEIDAAAQSIHRGLATYTGTLPQERYVPGSILKKPPAGGGAGAGVTPPVRVGSPEEARKLKPGTRFIIPDGSGRIGTVP